MKYVLVSVVIAVSTLVTAQAPQHKSVVAQPLSTPLEWGSSTRKFFSDSDRKMTFTLVTSWIPGDRHQGMFRYRMTGSADKLPLAFGPNAGSDRDSPDEIERFIKRVHSCSMTLALYDADNFILRKIPLEFGLGVDNNAHVTGLWVNDSVQMDISEYRQLMGTPPKSGSWNISWACSDGP